MDNVTMRIDSHSHGQLDTAAVGKLCCGSDVTHFVLDRCDYLPYIEFYERFYEALQIPPELRQRINRENVLTLISP